MKRFARLFEELDQTNKTNDKVQILKTYFLDAPDEDKLWALALFTHRRPKRQINTTLLRIWTADYAGIPDWLFEESYHTVGDLAETISLLLPITENNTSHSLTWWINYLQDLKDLEESEKKARIINAWQSLDQKERFVFTKLITGGFRIGVSQNLVTRAIAEAFDIDKSVIAHRLMGDWHPDRISFQKLILEERHQDDHSKPYPFYLAHPIEDHPKELGSIKQWQIEWKWDGIRGQIIIRGGEVYIWSRGEELVTDKFPELHAFKSLPDGTVLDGEIIPYADGQPLSFALLQTRIGRKVLSKKILQEAPISFIAYDLLEWKGSDIRESPQEVRRSLLEELHERFTTIPTFILSPLISADSWDHLAQLRKKSREMLAEGMMIKHKDAAYEVGRKRGSWWKWKIDPLTIDGVMLYAQKGHGRRADLFTDYTLAVWNGDLLVPFAKAYSGLTDAELKEIDAFVKKNTKEKFGPVRTVVPELVFEIAFEGIQKSPRHKSGIALRFPRILRWRKDKTAKEANTLADLKKLLSIYG